MLFDLQGKRRRVVQATYLTLAVLMGGGLVLFGVGGSVSGGLIDAFTGGSTGGSGSDIVKDRVESNEARIKRRPRDVEARKELVRDYYSLAFSQTPDSASSFSEDAKDELQKASVHWDAYLELAKSKPDPTVARIALQVYDQPALDQPDKALSVARLIAERANDPGSYIQLIQYAAIANDKRTQKLAKDKALALARGPEERKAVKDQLKQIVEAQLAQQLQQKQLDAQGTTTAPAGGGTEQPTIKK